MASLLELIPTKILFVLVFAVLPVAPTNWERGTENVTIKEWVSYGLILLGGVLVYGVSLLVEANRMQRYLWPLLVVLGLGLLLYSEMLVERGEWDESTIKRGGASYEED